MNTTITPTRLVTQTFANNRQLNIVSATPNFRKLNKRKSDRKLTLITLSFALIAALGCIALVIGSSSAEAANLPIFTAAKALSAKQDASVGGMATLSLVSIAVGALAFFSAKKK